MTMETRSTKGPVPMGCGQGVSVKTGKANKMEIPTGWAKTDDSMASGAQSLQIKQSEEQLPSTDPIK